MKQLRPGVPGTRLGTGTDMIMKHAILIGINGYAPDSGLAPLRFAEDDARNLGR